MTPENRKQVRLILDMRREEAEKRIADAVKALHADHAAKGSLQSGATTKKHYEIIATEGTNFVKLTLDEISDVSMSTEAFALFQETLMIFINKILEDYRSDPVVQYYKRYPNRGFNGYEKISVVIATIKNQAN